MNKISPSVMCIHMTQFKEIIASLDNAGVDFYHIDIMDGHFVPNFCLNGYLMKDLANLSRTPMDVHLMITNPTEYISFFASCGARYITMHIETLLHPIRALKQIHENGCLAGIAINPATPVDTLKYVVNYVDLVLVMTVDPGFSGQAMIPETIKKITEIKNLFASNNKDIEIMVDGQVKENTAPKYVSAGATSLVLGNSGLFSNYRPEQYMDIIHYYKNLKP